MTIGQGGKPPEPDQEEVFSWERGRPTRPRDLVTPRFSFRGYSPRQPFVAPAGAAEPTRQMLEARHAATTGFLPGRGGGTSWDSGLSPEEFRIAQQDLKMASVAIRLEYPDISDQQVEFMARNLAEMFRGSPEMRRAFLINHRNMAALGDLEFQAVMALGRVGERDPFEVAEPTRQMLEARFEATGKPSGLTSGNPYHWISPLFENMDELYLQHTGAISRADQILKRAADAQGSWGNLERADSWEEFQATVVPTEEVLQQITEWYPDLDDSDVFDTLSTIKRVSGKSTAWKFLEGGGVDAPVNYLALAIDPATPPPSFSAADRKWVGPGNPDWNPALGAVATMLVRLPPGIIVENNIDAIAAYTAAYRGVGGQLVAGSDKLPGNQTMIGAVWETMGDVRRAIVDNPGVGMVLDAVFEDHVNGEFSLNPAQAAQLQESAAAAETKARTRIRNDLVASGSKDALFVEMVTAMDIVDPETRLSPLEAQRVWDNSGMVFQQAGFGIDDWLKQKEDTLYEMQLEWEANRGGIQRNVSRALDTVFGVVEFWDSLWHGTLSNIAVDLGLEGKFADTADYEVGRELFQAAAAESFTEGGPWLSRTLGISGSAGFTFDLITSIANPVEWMLYGGAGRHSRRLLTHIMENPHNAEAVGRYFAGRQFRHIWGEIASGNGEIIDDVWRVGITEPGRLRLRRLAEKAAAKRVDIPPPSALEELGAREFISRVKGYTPEQVDSLVGRARASALADAMAISRRSSGVTADEVHAEIIEMFARGDILFPPTLEGITGRRAARGLGEIVRNWDHLPRAAQERTTRFFETASGKRLINLNDMRADMMVYIDTLPWPPAFAGKRTFWRKRLTEVLADNQIGRPQAIKDLLLGFEGTRQRWRGVLADVDNDGALRAIRSETTTVETLARRIAMHTGDTTELLGDLSAALDRLTVLAEQVQDAHKRFIRPMLKEIRQKRTELSRLLTPADNVDLQRFAEEFFDDVADTIRLTEPDFEWKNLGLTRAGEQEVVSTTLNQHVFLDGLEEPTQRILKALDLHASRGNFLAPGSPYDIMAYMVDKKGFWKIQEQVTKAMKETNAKWLMESLHKIWVLQLLLNPMTLARIGIDETLRFLELTGDIVGFGKGTVSSLPWLHKIPGMSPSQRALTTMGEDTFDLSLGSNRVWETVTGHPRFSERWVNQGFVNNPAIRAALAGPEEFQRWYMQVGRLKSNIGLKVKPTRTPGKFTLGRGAITFDDMYKAVIRGYENLLKQVKDPALRSELDELIKVGARDGKMIEKNKAWWRKLGIKAPGIPEESILRHPGQAMIRGAFASPQNRRGAVFFDHFYDMMRGSYETRFQGKLLSKAAIREKFPSLTDTQVERAWRESMANPYVVRMVEEMGYMLPSTLDEMAAQFAKHNADLLMYNIGVRSAMGKALKNVFPFAPAQIDFVDWWVRRLGRGTALKTGPRSVSKTLGIGSHQIPFNVQLANRWGIWSRQIGRGIDEANPEQDPRQRAWADTDNLLLDIIRDLTFIPDQPESMMQAVGVNIGPWGVLLVQNLMQLGIIDEDVLDDWGALLPGLGFIDREAGNFAELFGGVFLPSSGRTINSQIQGLAQKTLPFNGWIQAVRSIAQNDSIPPAYRFYMDDYLIQRVQTDGALLFGIGGDTANAESLENIHQRALDSAYNRDADVRLAANVPGRMFSYLHTGYAEHYIPLVRELTGVTDPMDRRSTLPGPPTVMSNLAERVGIPAQSLDELTDMIQAYDAGLLPPEGIEDFVLRMNNLLFSNFRGTNATELLGADGEVIWEGKTTYLDLAYLSHPETIYNSIGWYKVVGDVPEELRGTVDAEGRLQTNDPTKLEELDNLNLLQLRGRDERYDAAVYRARISLKHKMYDILDFAGAGVAESQKLGTTFEHVEGLPNGFRWGKRYEGTDLEEDVVRSFTFDLMRGTYDEVEIQLPRRVLSELETYSHGQLLTHQIRGVITGAQLREWVSAANEMLETDFDLTNPFLSQMLVRPRTFNELNPLHLDATQGVKRRWDNLVDFMENEGYESISLWPEEMKTIGREIIGEAVVVFPELKPDYQEHMQRALGALDWVPDLPTSLDDADHTVWSGSPDDLLPIDGDTIAIPIMGIDRPQNVRIIGLNTPEKGQEGAEEAEQNLLDLLNEAEEITFVLYKPEVYGLANKHWREGGLASYRVNVWLFADGVPIYDPSQFTSGNERGTKVGGDVVDVVEIYRRGKRGLGERLAENLANVWERVVLPDGGVLTPEVINNGG